MDAAGEMFAAKGLSGARVQEIANLAGVDKQLISYYFGGKDGLCAEVLRRWGTREREFSDDNMPLSEVANRYLREVLADPGPTRLAYWDERNRGDVASTSDREMQRMRDRKRRGELAPELDEASVLLAITGMVTIAAAMPGLVERLFGVPPTHPDFADRYGAKLQRIVELLAPPSA